MPLSVIDVRRASTHLFSSIGIETCSRCNRRCKFCPVAYDDRPTEYMDMRMFDGILYDLRSLNYKGRIELYMYNEPLLDPNIEECIEHVRTIVPSSCIMISTNGDLIRGPDAISRLFECGLNQLLVNVYSSAKRASVLEGYVHSLGLENGNLYGRISPNKRVAEVSHKYTVEDGMLGRFHLTNRAGNIEEYIPAVTSPLDSICTRPFRFMNINWQGEAMLCCNDYSMDIDIGNVRNFSLSRLWNAPVLQLYRLKLQAHNRHMPVCDKCDFAGGYYTHMLHHVTLGYEADKRIKDADLIDDDNLMEALISVEAAMYGSGEEM